MKNSNFKRIFAVIFTFLFSSFFTKTYASTNITLIKNVLLIDGTGAPPKESMDVEIIESKIARIGKNLNSQAKMIIDGTGKTLIPGLIDCHVHIRSVPGSIFRNESQSKVSDQQKIQLQAYLAAGVTTILDAATPLKLFEEVAQFQKQNNIPRFFGLTPFLTPNEGYFASSEARGTLYHDLTNPIKKITDIHDRFEEIKNIHPLGTKVVLEYGFAPLSAFRVFNSHFRRKILEEADAAKLPIFVHSESEEAFWMAFDLKPYAFMHGGFFDKVASPEIIQKIYQSKAYVVSTLAIYKMMLLMWDQKIFDEAWFRLLVPDEQIKTAKVATPEVIKLLSSQNKPWFIPQFVAEFLSQYFIRRESIEQYYQNSKISLKAIYDSGTPIVMGSDSGNYPLFSTFFHGVGSILEVEALLDAGIPVLEVVRASTLRAAQMLKVDSEIGSITEGKTADLVLLNQNPIETSRAFRDIALVFKDGRAGAPKAWLLK